MQTTVVCVCVLTIPMLIMLLILMALSIKKKCNHLNNVPSHRQSQPNPHTTNACLVISGKLRRLRDLSMSTVSGTLHLKPGFTENPDGFVSEKNRANGADADSESCDVFSAHSLMRSNKLIGRKPLLTDNSRQTGKFPWCLFMGRLYKKGMNPGQPKRLLDEVRELMRVRRYVLRTEQSYYDWIRRYVKFHGMKCRADLASGKEKVEAFLTDLAVAAKCRLPHRIRLRRSLDASLQHHAAAPEDGRTPDDFRHLLRPPEWRSGFGCFWHAINRRDFAAVNIE